MSVDSGRVRVIQVGTGPMGRAWLRTLRASDRVELVGAVELDLDLARRATAEHGFAGVPVAPSVTALVEAGVRADAVINASVPRAHLPVNTEALRLGLPTLCEKPLSESLAECLRMAAVSEVTGTLLMVSQSRRYWRALHALRREAPRLGPLAGASCQFAKLLPAQGFRAVMPQVLLVDMAIHHFDQARLLLDGDPVRVVADSWNPPGSAFTGDAHAAAIFTFDNGTRFSYTGGWSTPGLETSWNGQWRLTGRLGSASWDGDHAPVIEAGAVNDGFAHPGLDPVETLPPGDEPEEITGSLTEFLDTLAAGSSAPVPQGEVHTNIASVAMVRAAVRSAETGGPVLLTELVEEARLEARQTEPDPAVRAALESAVHP